MNKVYLMTPGPTPVPDKIRRAESQEIIHHRTKEHSEIFKRVSDNLKPIFKTKNPVLTFASSGTGAMEGSVINTLSSGDKVLIPIVGKFSERWVEICEAYGVEVVSVEVEWGNVVEPEVIKEHLDNDPDIKAVFTTLCETSAGVVCPIKEYGEIIKNRPNTILVVDAISGLGACDIQNDEWGVDICVSGSQKGLMMPPGLAFASVSDKARGFIEHSNLPKYYFDWKKALKSWEKADTPYTPAVSLIVALDEALKMLNEEGIDNVLARHSVLADAMRAAMKSMGLELLSSNYPSNTVTAVKVPDGVDGIELKNVLDKKYGIKIAGGQSHLKGKIFRVAHLGYMGEFDVITAISAIELTLKGLGYSVELGSGVRAAEEVFLK